ncbi:hypothetical protein J9303_04765 [Bacillaceae bacterium Marseille-Q3522]|nr:hypothetical protein [Bacillaceae bacterium Marseille-Q3522]
MLIKESIGQVSELEVVRNAPFGWFLSDGEEDVLLHEKEASGTYEIGDRPAVFLYTDSKGRIAATDKLPAITAGTYGWAKVSDVKPDFGVFIDIGIQKEMLFGKDDLPVHKEVWPQVGDFLFLTLRVNKNGRLYVRLASEKIIAEKAALASREDFNRTVQGYIYRTAKVGSWVLTSENFRGFIHESQRQTEPRLGEKVTGRIIDVKEDGTINVSLLPRKEEALDIDAANILAYLQSRNGSMPYSDKSLPEDIQGRFQLSKAAFKRALGKLMKEGKVYQKEGWTFLKE